jgi:hypothetical protein
MNAQEAFVAETCLTYFRAEPAGAGDWGPSWFVLPLADARRKAFGFGASSFRIDSRRAL